MLLIMKSSSNSWFAPVEINGKTYKFLSDSAVTRSSIGKDVYENQPEPKPILQNTNMTFQMANRSNHKAMGVYIPLKMKLCNLVKTKFSCLYL